MVKNQWQEYQHSIQRIHERIDKDEIDMRKVKTTLWGDPEKNIEGFIPQNDKFVTEIKIYLKIISTIGAAFVVALIGVLIKLWFVK